MLRVFLLLACLLSGCSRSTKAQRIGIDSSWYPLDIPGKEPQITAFSDELLQEIARLEKIEITKVSVSWDKLLWGLQKKKDQPSLYDAVLTLMQPQIFLEKQYTFSNVYLSTGPVLIVSSSSFLSSIDQLGGKEIAILRGSNDALILEKNPAILIRIYDAIPEMLSAIVEGTIDGALLDILRAEAYCQDLYHDLLKIATPPLNEEGLRLVALYGEAENLISAFNDGLLLAKNNGSYDALLQKWKLIHK